MNCVHFDQRPRQTLAIHDELKESAPIADRKDMIEASPLPNGMV